MATTKRKKKFNLNKMIARLKVLVSKDELTREEEKELDDLLNRLGRKQKNKLNIAVHNDSTPTKVAWAKDSGHDFITPDHFSSASGTYRKAKIDNRKNKES